MAVLVLAAYWSTPPGASAGGTCGTGGDGCYSIQSNCGVGGGPCYAYCQMGWYPYDSNGGHWACICYCFSGPSLASQCSNICAAEADGGGVYYDCMRFCDADYVRQTG